MGWSDSDLAALGTLFGRFAEGLDQDLDRDRG
jgi:hypothetical protein